MPRGGREDEARNNSCIALDSVPSLGRHVEDVRGEVCHPIRFWILTACAVGRTYCRRIACPQQGFRPLWSLLANTQSSGFWYRECSRHFNNASASSG